MRRVEHYLKQAAFAETAAAKTADAAARDHLRRMAERYRELASIVQAELREADRDASRRPMLSLV